MATPQLGDLLAEVVPKDARINVRHVSTTPTRCEAIFSAPPGEDPETTFCESHFLVVTLNRDDAVDDEVAILGVEVYIYTTERLTTLFVSKADSTGYLHLLNGAPEAAAIPRASLLRTLTTAFLSYLTHAYQRTGVRLVLSLFARAQSQYLFPGSADNKRKHILDDRGLIKWWCRAADPIVREHAAESQESSDNTASSLLDEKAECLKSSATAYLLVPGCDRYETRAFFPAATARSDVNHKEHARWRVSYPLNQLCGHAQHAPPRCLIPRFPDDPKARFLVDLDDELPKNPGDSETASRGLWRSVKSLDEFWEMMSFRQECSAGRLVGFLWLIINPPGLLSSDKVENQAVGTASVETAEATNTSSAGDKVLSNSDAPATTAAEAKFDDRSLSALRNGAQGTDVGRNPFFWPEAGRGEIILGEADYKSANDILLEQDFETEELAMAGTMAWVRKVASVADVLWWGNNITGKKEPSAPIPTLDTGLIVRKRKKDVHEAADAGLGEKDTNTHTVVRASTEASTPGVNVLNASFVRKKKKT
jgi:regulator of Ty1 transposition protein 109